MDKRLKDLLKHAENPDNDVSPGSLNNFEELNLPPNSYASFPPDPSYSPTNDGENPLNKENKPFAEPKKPTAASDAELKAFRKEQSKKVDNFWKNKMGN